MSAFERNPVFWLMWLIPGTAVLAGFGMVAIAMQGADRALPEIYHWEGAGLDADFERARVAAQLGITAGLSIRAGECRLALTGDAPSGLELRLTSGSDARLDRGVTLVRAADGLYRGACAPLARGKWRVALRDADGAWALRTQLDEPAEDIVLRARAPEPRA